MLKASIRLEGEDLIMNNSQKSDPLNEFALELAKATSVRKKTVADHKKISQIEWFGGLWLVNGVPGIPADAQFALIGDGAKKSKLGQQVKIAVFPMAGAPLIYDGPKKLDKLQEDPRFTLRKSLKQGTSRIIRTRPFFPEWAVEFEVMFDEDEFTADQFQKAISDAGRKSGLGDSRPRNGRFRVTKFEVSDAS